VFLPAQIFKHKTFYDGEINIHGENHKINIETQANIFVIVEVIKKI
jgi:hypothetical protein